MVGQAYKDRYLVLRGETFVKVVGTGLSAETYEKSREMVSSDLRFINKQQKSFAQIKGGEEGS